MLLRVEITNFRSCRELVLNDLSGVLALIGRNGAGKTNILRAIEWAAKTGASTQPSTIEIHQLFSKGGLPDVKLVFTSGDACYAFSITQVSIPAPEKSRTSLPTLGLVERLSLVEAGIERLLVTRLNEKVTVHDGRPEISIGAATPFLKALIAILPEEDPLQPRIREVAAYLDGIRYYPLDKIDNRDRFIPGSDYQTWSENASALGRSPDESAVMRLIDLYLHRRADFDEVAQLVGGYGLDIVNSISVNEFRFPRQIKKTSDSAIESGEAEENAGLPDFYSVNFVPSGFDEHDGFGFDDLSYGTKRLLTIVIALVYDRSRVMLIEQPEDGIHIGLLNKLTPMFRSYSESRQFVLASHSRDVLDRFLPKELRLVRLSEGRTIARSLTGEEIATAERFIAEDGPLTDFVETLGDE